MKDILRSGFRELGVPYTEEALDALERFYDLLEERNKVMNLTAIRSREDAARLHFLDCAAPVPLLSPGGKRVLDVGSGAGFPGLVWKILCPDTELTMLDSLQKRVAFQRETADALGLTGVAALAGRAEEAAALRESFDIVTCRAVAGLNVLCELCLPLVKPGGVFAAMKGPAPEEEIETARRGIRELGGGEVAVVKYAVPGTDAVHSLVTVTKAAPTPKKYPRAYAQIKKRPL